MIPERQWEVRQKWRKPVNGIDNELVTIVDNWCYSLLGTLNKKIV